MNTRTIEDISVEGKKVLLRVDYNVPLDSEGRVTDDTRIRATLRTIRYLREKNARIIIISHLGRPKGKRNEKYSLKPAAEILEKLIGVPVKMAPDCIGGEVKKMVQELRSGEILLLENVRFHPGEEKNDLTFARELSSLGDIFIQEAFGSVHRAHASTAGINKYIESAAGFLLSREIEYLSKAVHDPRRPFMVILGGAKVSGKIDVIENLIPRIDILAIGGGMAYTFLKAQGYEIGSSLLEPDKIELASTLLHTLKEKNIDFILPCDHLVADAVTKDSPAQPVDGPNIPPGKIGVDIGPRTVQSIKKKISSAKTILWNGPMGVFEIDQFAKGTMQIAQSIARASEQGAVSIVGGGDSVSALKKSGVSDKISHISTGGGASLEFLEGKELPGIVAIAQMN